MGFGTLSASSAFGGVAYAVPELPVLAGYARVAPADLNNSGNVIGTAYSASAGYQPVLWDQGMVTSLPAPVGDGVWTFPMRINDSGIIAGRIEYLDGSPVDAVVWFDGGFQKLGGAAGVGGRATAINGLGQIVGGSDVGGTERATLWDGGASRRSGSVGRRRVDRGRNQ